MSTTPLPLSDIITVNVSAAVSPVAPRQFNQGLIVGSSTVIPSYGNNSRLRQYASVSAMLTDGFLTSSPEYLAASLYFAQNPAPLRVWIGRQDLTAIQTLNPHSGSAGTGYVVNDIITVVQAGASYGEATVTSIGAGGAVTGLSPIVGHQGTGYSVANGLTTTGGTGTGLEVDITAIGESLLQAVTACALENQDWYGFMCIGAVDSDHEALALYSTDNWQNSFYFLSSSDAGIPAGTAGNLALTLQAAKYYCVGMYNTTQGGLYPNNIYAAAALLGVYCGLDTGLAGSYFILAHKTLAGVQPEPLTQTQYSNIIAANFNVCANFGSFDGLVETGITSSGLFFDQLLFRATLINLIQTNLMDLLVSTPAVPQTDAGEHQLISQVEDACATLASVGYIGPGTYTGAPLLSLVTGQSLPLGYIVQAPSYATQSSANRAARQAMPIYATILEAGGVNSVTVQLNIQQ